MVFIKSRVVPIHTHFKSYSNGDKKRINLEFDKDSMLSEKRAKSWVKTWRLALMSCLDIRL